jgi:hypothetical protein
MKKLGFFAMAIAMLAMIGCNKNGNNTDPENVDVQSVTVTPNAIEIPVGGSYNLKAVTDPVGGTITWESADETVATVTSAGVVEGIAEGKTTITAKSGGKTGTCQVTVSLDAAYNLNVLDYGLFGETTMIPGTDTILSFSFGDATCQLGYISDVYAWDGDAAYVSGNGFVGEGNMLHFENLAVYWIMDGDYKGYYVGAGYFTSYPVDDPDYVRPYNCLPGQLDPASYFEFVKAQYSADIEADFDAMMAKTWGSMLTLKFADEDYPYSYYGLYNGHINQFVFVDADEDEEIDAMWAGDMDWANQDVDRIFGYRWDTTYYIETKELRFIEPYDYATVHRVYDDNGIWDQEDEEEAAPARLAAKKTWKLGNMSRLHKGVKIEGRKEVR